MNVEVRDAIEATVAEPSRPLSARDREDMIRSVIGSQALEGVHRPWDEVARIVDDVLAEPPLVYPPQR
jgi:hypothetical protein